MKESKRILGAAIVIILAVGVFMSVRALSVRQELRSRASQNVTNSYGLLAYWSLDESSGIEITDGSGKNYHGSANGTSVVSGKIANARKFNGTSDAIRVRSLIKPGRNIRTISAWISPSSVPSSQEWIAGSAWGSQLVVNKEGHAAFYVWLSDIAWYAATDPNPIAVNEWTHYVGSITNATPSSTTVRLYKNGNLLSEQSFGRALRGYTECSFWLGGVVETNAQCKNKNNRQFYRGSIDDVRVYNRVLTDAEIKSLASDNSTVTPLPSNTPVGQSIPCSTLAAVWTGGNATKKPSGDYDVSGCSRNSGVFEMVKPAQRDPAKRATARCNDGTPFGFDVQLAPSGSTQLETWVINLQGGGMCDDYAKPCSGRTVALSSSPPATDRSIATTGPNFGGILDRNDPQNKVFGNANHVFAYYCSSDDWSGSVNTPKLVTGKNFYFSGHDIVKSLFEILKERYGLDDANAQTKVLFTGQSAGACGVVNNAYIVKSDYLPQTATGGRLKLLLDACWVPEWDEAGYRIGAATTSDLDVANRMARLWQSQLDPACMAAYPDDPGKCHLILKYAYPYLVNQNHLNLPVFVQQSSHDESIEVENHGISRSPSDPIVQQWKAQILTEFNLAPVKWIFSSDAVYHTISTKSSTYPTGWCRSEATTGQRFCDMLTRFWNDDYSGLERVITP